MKDNKGFTLIELIIVVAIMGIVMTATSSFFISNLRAFSLAEDQFETQHNSSMAVGDIGRQIMECEGIDTYDSTNQRYIFYRIRDGARTYIRYDYDSSSNTLSSGIGSTKSSITMSSTAEAIEAFSIDLLREDGTTISPITPTTITETKGISLRIRSEESRSSIDIDNTFFFRN